MWLPYTLASIACLSVPIVINSVQVKYFEKSPMLVMWSQSIFSVFFLFFLARTTELETEWVYWLMFGSAVAYAGDLLFFLAIDRMDASVTLLTTSFLAIFLSIAGFIFFGESWTFPESIGVVFILGGVFFLSCWHKYVELRSLLLLILMAVVYLPFYVAQKAALQSGDALMTVLFWLLVPREMLAVFFPWFLPSFRSKFRSFPRRVGPAFFLLSFTVIVFWLLSIYFGGKAYQVGAVSLVSVVSNTQPFIVIFLAWLLWKLHPAYASRELLDMQSLQVKLGSFAFVFVGLAVLAFS